MIKNIIFDLGGVLLTEDDNWIHLDEVQRLLKSNFDKLNEAFDRAWPDARDGKIDEDKFFEIILLNSLGKVDTEIIQQLKSIYRKHADKYLAYPALELLYGKYRLFALTNVTNEWIEFKRKEFNLDNYLETIISSCGEGVAKPKMEIYQNLITKADINPQESVFIDNMKKNLIPARELGLTTILFQDFEHLKIDLEIRDIYFNDKQLIEDLFRYSRKIGKKMNIRNEEDAFNATGI